MSGKRGNRFGAVEASVLSQGKIVQFAWVHIFVQINGWIDDEATNR